jgi:hypothetical protein
MRESARNSTIAQSRLHRIGSYDYLMFFTFCLAAITSASLHAEELSIKITLGIRDTNRVATTNVAYPLAFRIDNTGKAVVKGDQIPDLFFKGVIHLLPKDGKEQQTDFPKFWRTRIYDLQPGATSESPVVADILTFFPLAKDGVYQVWWTVGDLKSNVLRFTVAKGKAFRNDSKA